jgi:hypothetical protein
MSSGRPGGIQHLSESMSLDELAGHIERFDALTPITADLIRRVFRPGEETKPEPLKKSWLGWISNYPKTDVNRRKDSDRDARFVYNHLHMPVMLLWLAESAGVSRDLLERASAAVPADTSGPTQCAQLRKAIPWKHVEAALGGRPGSFAQA